jgi:hypothetical protein
MSEGFEGQQRPESLHGEYQHLANLLSLDCVPQQREQKQDERHPVSPPNPLQPVEMID